MCVQYYARCYDWTGSSSQYWSDLLHSRLWLLTFANTTGFQCCLASTKTLLPRCSQSNKLAHVTVFLLHLTQWCRCNSYREEQRDFHFLMTFKLHKISLRVCAVRFVQHYYKTYQEHLQRRRLILRTAIDPLSVSSICCRKSSWQKPATDTQRVNLYFLEQIPLTYLALQYKIPIK